MQLIHNRARYCSELNYNSHNHIIGLSALGILTKNWSFGTEIYYTAKEHSGGCECQYFTFELNYCSISRDKIDENVQRFIEIYHDVSFESSYGSFIYLVYD
jgi:hypothetical protein